ncbi:hypothetical protein FB451DRAFT_1307457 [Mycena latifolia]|nr:hypothetical protein FB451DRAFT_1571064 [Mycena latifolia]KAJ7436419.1 hypothetical protein FB451DRAFT_1307457 [Mycena latifolia]
MTSIQNTAIVQSRLIGAVGGGDHFDDINAVTGSNFATINTKNPIKSIRVIYGEVVDGLAIEYRVTDSTTAKKEHGVTPNINGGVDAGLKSEVIELSNTQVIIAVTGMHGEPPDSKALGGARVVQINFVIFDNADGTVETKGPYGTKFAKPFYVTADGNFVAFGGYATNQEESILKKPTGGLFGLTFYDVQYTAV